MSIEYFQMGIQRYLEGQFKASVASFDKVTQDYHRRYKLIFRTEKVLDFLISDALCNLAQTWKHFVYSIYIAQYLPPNQRAALLHCQGILQANIPGLDILNELIDSKKTNKARKIGLKAIKTNRTILERKIKRTLSNLHTSTIQ